MSKFPYEPWTVTENGFQRDALRENESAFALGNGFIGMRGNLEELTATGSETIQGSFLNGIFDSEPIVYGEGAYGYAKNHETICNVMDAKSITLLADGERLDLGLSHVEEHVRQLDMRAGLLRRSFVWHTAGGCTLEVETERLVSLTRQELADLPCRAVLCLQSSPKAIPTTRGTLRARTAGCRPEIAGRRARSSPCCRRPKTPVSQLPAPWNSGHHYLLKR